LNFLGLCRAIRRRVIALLNLFPVGFFARTNIMALAGFYESKIETAEREITQKTSNLRRLEAQRYQLNNRVRRLKEELQLLQQPASYVGEVIKTMGKKKVLVKCHPEGKYGI
jgi:26S proteasome regulatory subunit T6